MPTFGAILLSPSLDKVLMVKGWKAGASWGFPKGKVNKEEVGSHCAAREVFEETGFDVGPLLREPDFLELTSEQQRTKLFLVTGVSEEACG